MSRIGRLPVVIPQGVEVTIDHNQVRVKGPKGELVREFHPDMEIVGQDGQLVVRRPTDQPMHRALHGLSRALLQNMVTGVSEGFRKELQIEGVGYRAEVQRLDLVLHVGFSHPVRVAAPEGVSFDVDRSGRQIAVEGIDKELVGQVAAKVRAVRPPEPYKGKGVRYVGERVRIKAGKAGKVGLGGR